MAILSHQWAVEHSWLENGLIEDVLPIEDGDSPLPC